MSVNGLKLSVNELLNTIKQTNAANRADIDSVNCAGCGALAGSPAHLKLITMFSDSSLIITVLLSCFTSGAGVANCQPEGI